MTDPFSIILNRLWSIKGIGPVLKQRIIQTVLEVRDETEQARIAKHVKRSELKMEVLTLRKINESLLEEIKELREIVAKAQDQ